ncbi:hypothetical protein [Streptomyces sp. ICC4]|uniref:hypothetical protein n=1 Tax=Streptomyces sp. ICC4 TaxID=2099584 RepID=UPI001EF77400|nr:hypothetical protein [Streptomyces sp. ICC4]
MITAKFPTSATDVTTCEACWREPVETARTAAHAHGRDLLCIPCAEAGYAARVDLFPPLGIYKLNGRTLKMTMDSGRHGTPGGSRGPPGVPCLPESMVIFQVLPLSLYMPSGGNRSTRAA